MVSTIDGESTMILSAIYTDDYFGPCYGEKNIQKIRDCTTLLVLWGGEDISPHIYGQSPVRTNAPPVPSPRDWLEMELIDEARRRDIPILGICRGAQLLCAVDGGTLWQDVSGHGIAHNILYKGEKIPVSSTHHQMMRPSKHAEVLASSEYVRSPKKFGEEEEINTEPEAEIVYFPRLNALGVQGHPEYMVPTHPFPQLVKSLVKTYLKTDIL